MKNYLTSTILFLFIFFNSYSKEHILKTHVELIGALTEIKSNSTSIRNESKSWSDADQQKLKGLYITLKAKDDALIAKYETIIPQWKRAKKMNITVDDDMKELEKANNEFVDFFKSTYLKYSPAPKLNITAEIIKLVLDGLGDTWKWYKNLRDEERQIYLTQVRQQKLADW